MKWSRKRVFWLIAAAALVAVIVWAFLPNPVPVDLVAISRGPLQVTVEEDGRTRIKERYIVSSPLTGRLRRIGLDPGDPVEAGQTLIALIEPSDPQLLDARSRAEAEARVRAAEAALKQASPNLERARSAHEFAKTELERTRELARDGAASQQELDAAATRERTTAEELKAAEFALQIAQYELEQAEAVLLRSRPGAAAAQESGGFEVHSPISGRVLRVFQESATVVTPGAQLVEVGDPTDLEIEVDVLSTDAVRIRPGAKMILEHWGGDRPLLARVRLVEPAAFLKISALGVEEQRVYVIGDFVDPPEQRETLGDAYRVEARIVVWASDTVLKVPGGALFRSDGQWAVYAADRGRARLRPLQIGHQNSLDAEVLEGLSENEPVILHPSDRIRDGVRITPREAVSR